VYRQFIFFGFESFAVTIFDKHKKRKVIIEKQERIIHHDTLSRKKIVIVYSERMTAVNKENTVLGWKPAFKIKTQGKSSGICDQRRW